MQEEQSLHGQRIFAVVWGSQLVSLIGSGLTSFVLGLWVYQRTSSVTLFALILFSSALPRIFLSPVAGMLTDRWDRRMVMLLSDAGAGLSILAVALLFFTQQLATWHIYVATAFSSACGTFQYPAYVAATTQLVARRNIGRANGLLQLGLASQDVIGPVLAGFLVAIIQPAGVLLIDVGTFLVAITALLIVKFPWLPVAGEERGDRFHVCVDGYTCGVANYCGILYSPIEAGRA